MDVFVVHADWSKHAGKRWMTVIRRAPSPEVKPSPFGRGLGEGVPSSAPASPSHPHPGPLPKGEGIWRVGPPEPVGDPATLLARLGARANGAAVALGIDCPIGLPRAYAAMHARHNDFPAFLRDLPCHSAFLDVAATLSDVSASRPFYPARGLAGMTRLSHALALGLPDASALSRACDRATAERPAGAPVFWTLGANQSGKAAISAWRDLLGPALRGQRPPRLWPFDGPFRSLLAPGCTAVAETYPAEALHQLGLRAAGSKRRQADRAAYAPAIQAAMARLHARPDSPEIMADGFGSGADGEDKLDCLLGALCVLSVVTGLQSDTAPEDTWISTWEGWVLGQTARPRASAHDSLPGGEMRGGAPMRPTSRG